MTMKTLLTLFIIALIIRLVAMLWWQFDGLYGQDAYAYWQQASAIAENLPKGQPPPPDFFWPNGFPLLIAFLTLLTGQTPLAGQLAALLGGALLAPLAYLLSQELLTNSVQKTQTGLNKSMATRNHRAGILTGLIVALAGQPILSSLVIMADMPALLWATLAAWLVVRAARRLGEVEGPPSPPKGGVLSKISPSGGVGELPSSGGSGELPPSGGSGGFPPSGGSGGLPPSGGLGGPRSAPSALWFLGAGAALAMAIISRWLYILITPGLAGYVIFKMYQNRVLSWQPLWAVLSGSVILGPQLWLSLNKPAGLFHSWLLGWHPTNFFGREFTNIDGHFVYQLPVGLFYAQPAGHPAYIFPLLGFASLWGVWRLWRTRAWGPLILLLGWAGPVYFFLAGIPYQNFRFGLTLYLPLVILTGFGVSDLWQELHRPRATGEFPAAPLFFDPAALLKTLTALSLLGMLAWAYPMLDDFLSAQNQSKLIARQVEQTLPQEAALLTFGLTLTFQHYTQLKTSELFYLNEAALDALTASQTPFYLLLDVENIERQWQGRAPALNYHWLRDHTKLTRMADFPPYTLFKAERLKF